ncbi:class I SAM-dependent methyltransferase [Kordia sp. YSTF-M3]|uniref:Class I SAM-dependent methyltransferase n=1 Tax=Kordia aestuariivivens TaxID=2759037 RepID=A0ABR7QCC7_9FLAO|nr:class I SAM-dependent methyltransferase [Kordia aestuariivivens]MBC8756021.1 class I SAM-dependent methyltransferase [Kordia aestuariivivens]
MTTNSRHASSYRDPSGHVYIENNLIKRIIFPSYFPQYEALKSSGFFEKAFQHKLLIPHEETERSATQICIQPEQIPFITYPYEWSFQQYKEAALLTLKLQKYALQNDFSLKDATAYNIAFHNGNAIFIDTLSLDFYQENTPWRAYKQFVTHFLGPLVLAKYHGAEFLKTMSNFIDGVPLKMIASLLPKTTKLNPFLYTNIHLLAKYENKHQEEDVKASKQASLSKKGLFNIIDNLYNYIKKLQLNEQSEWGNYYQKTNYSDNAFSLKSNIINEWIQSLHAKKVIDVGGNDGTFVRQITSDIELALVGDIDNNAVDQNHYAVKKDKETNMLPFVIDLLNPSAAIGFQNTERFSFVQRVQEFKPDVTLALALIHHLSLTGNVPFENSAAFFAAISEHLIIEFPKRNDSYATRLLNAKAEFKDQFGHYNLEDFERTYSEYFELIDKKEITDSERVLYLFKKKDVK